MADHDKQEPIPIGGYGLIQKLVPKPIPEDSHASNFEPSLVRCNSLTGTKPENKVLPGKAV